MMADRSQESNSAAVVSRLPITSQDEWAPLDRESAGDGQLSAHDDSSESDEIATLFARYSRLALATAYRVLGDVYEAEDVVQEVFLYVYLKRQLFDPSKGSIKSWIVQIALSRALDRKLHLARRGCYAEADIDSLRLPAPYTSVEELVAARLNRKYIEKAFSGLTNMQRQTLRSFFFEGLDLRDISEQLSQPLGTVRHYLYRGLERLRKNSLLVRLR